MYFLRWFAPVILLACLALSSYGQKNLYNQQQRINLERLGKEFEQTNTTLYQRAASLARQRGLPLQKFRGDGSVIILQGVDERGNLLYDATYSATRAAQTTRTSSLYSGGGLGLSLSGSSAVVQNKLGIWDGGRVLATHIELADRVTQVDNVTRNDNHATHVAGIMIGAGINPQARGMAFGGKLRAWDFSNDDAEMAAAASDLLVSNHSYGSLAGWVYDADRTGDIKWEWYGDTTISATEDHKFGIYNSEARDWDRIAINAPYYLIVKSAGNNHGQNGPGANQPYYIGSSNTVSRTPRKDQNGYDQIATYGTAKNILSVGAISALSVPYTQPADARIASFSSWGPTDDGRIKPDLVGVGVSVLSAGSVSNNTYATLSGTSMSAPNVSGSLFLLQEYFAQLNGGRFMRSSTLRGLAIHTTDEAGDNPGPDYRFGWGLLNTERAARVIGNADRSHLLEERTLTAGQTYTVQLVASGRGPLVATICWTDPEGTATASANINSRTPKLVNDLDIRLSSGQTTTLPWALNPAEPTQAATRSDNVVDNVEQIRIENPIPGSTYTLTVSHKGALTNARQDYALLASGVGGTVYCASAATSAGGTQIDRVRFAGIDQAGQAGCQPYTNFMTNVAIVAKGQQLPLEIVLGSCGNTRPSTTKVFIDWNLDGDFADAGELVATSGTLTAPATFASNLVIPPNLTEGQTTRLRIVTVETADNNAVLPCGNFANGETQEFLVRFTRPQNDVGVTALLAPENAFCGQDALRVGVRVQNFGTSPQTAILVTVRVTTADGTLVTTLTGTTTQPVAASAEASLTLQSPLTLQPGVAYRFTATTNLSSDQDTTNNQLAETRTTVVAPTPGNLTASYCGENPVALRSTGSGLTFWYDALTGGNLLAVGNATSTTVRPANNVYYAGINDFSGIVGPTEKGAFGGGTYAGNFGPQPLITTQIPLVLESARLYIGNAGRITFTVQRLDGTFVSSTTLDVTATRNPNTPVGTPPAGQTSDDPTDRGAEYPLNLRIPEPGDYKIAIEYENGASIFRSNVGVSGFPFSIPGVVLLKGSLFNNDTLKTAYYYLYNLKVKSLGCSAGQRTAVTAQPTDAVQATITPEGSTTACQGTGVRLRATESPAVSYQWLRDGQRIGGATTPVFSATLTGAYTVEVTGGCGPITSAPVAVTIQEPIRPTVTRDEYRLLSSAPSGNQWLLNGVAIPAATQQMLLVSQSGRYSVRANQNGCGELASDEITIEVITATTEPLGNGKLTIFPVPASHQVTIDYVLPVLAARSYQIQLTDLRGITIQKATMTRVQNKLYHTFDVSGLPAGIFLIVIQDAEGNVLHNGKMQKL
ncbi:S8 family serine peptidase [Tellurirhabdus bombi]|uniref:S8 family serine peptidase n=1 Tax=Tellurirhabdus bombi TaxID=2907205 RepID=UPI001F3ECB68|nr:S8 family serine peptidase [Tellurirhabdus bombi]